MRLNPSAGNGEEVAGLNRKPSADLLQDDASRRAVR